MAATEAVLSQERRGFYRVFARFPQRGQEIQQPSSEIFFFFYISGNKSILLLPFVSMEFLSASKINSASSYSFAILRGT